ncbi:MAG: response regulator transcription factor [Clostridia bacterium]|nr:response regulator transcription factor [Clostridia bacterium]
MRVLVVDDEADIRQILSILLGNAGYDTIEAQDGLTAVDMLREDRSIDLCIMDIMMPNMSGVDATAAIRKFSSVPVLFLTAKSLPQDKEKAYLSGGDDYLVKPFSPSELLLKVDALTRRYNSYGAKDRSLVEGIRLSSGVLVNLDAREVAKNGVRIELRDKELEVLFYLVKNRGRVVGAVELYEAVWGEIALQTSSNNITVHILNLRRKLEDDPSSPKVIRTVWGKGYQVD